MDFIGHVIKTIPLVTSVLKTDVKSRDDDNILLLAVWDIQALNSNKDIRSYSDFREMLLNGDLAVPSTIIRTRRRLQVKHPELRGDMYEERQKSDRIIRNQIRLNFDNFLNEG